MVYTSTQDYRYLLAATSGGRSINERPKECFIDYGADIDILSAYGQVLSSIYFPLGRSRIFTKTPNSLKKMTLGAFMDKYLDKMKKYKLFKILVTGKLSFEQDLIHSKIISEVGAKRKIERYASLEVGEQAISSEFILLRKEIINGSITFSTWEILEKVCTRKEMKEIRDLEVVSAIYHLDEDACFTIEEFLDYVFADKGEFSFDLKKSLTIDNRTYKFFPFPMNEFIGPLVKKRSILKKMKEDLLAQAQSHALKTLNNTYWGISTSVFFETNNVIFSEEVSNSTRNHVWLISKALNTHMSITDGGPFSLMNVSFFKDSKDKKPGLHCLSSYYFYSKHRNIKMGPLAGIDWKSYVEKNIPPTDAVFASLNDIAYEHIKNFWKTYNLDISFSVEMKIERTPFRRAASWSKAHYGMQIYCFDTKSYSKEEYIIRNFKQKDNVKHLYPMFYLLKHILKNPDLNRKNDKLKIENNGIYYTKKIMKLSLWRKNLIQVSKKKKVYKDNYSLYPGDSYLIAHSFRLNNNQCYINYYEDYKKRKQRNARNYGNFMHKGFNLVKRKPLFEKYLEKEGILSTLRKSNMNSL